MDYKKKILELLESCEDSELLELIYRFVLKLIG